MTLTADDTADSRTAISAEARAALITDAATAWGERLAADEQNGALTFRVRGEGVHSVATEVVAGGRHRFRVDEPAPLAGADTAASPVEYALGALISCQIVVYRLYAQQLGIRVDDVSVDAVGDLDVRGIFGVPGVRPGFSDVRLTVTVTGPESEERYRELAAHVDAHCPVFDLFTNPTPVSVEVRKA